MWEKILCNNVECRMRATNFINAYTSSWFEAGFADWEQFLIAAFALFFAWVYPFVIVSYFFFHSIASSKRDKPKIPIESHSHFDGNRVGHSNDVLYSGANTFFACAILFQEMRGAACSNHVIQCNGMHVGTRCSSLAQHSPPPHNCQYNKCTRKTNERTKGKFEIN